MATASSPTDTQATYQLVTRLGERYLEGELRANVSPSHSYKVFARNEQFLTKGGEFFRRNEIWREVIDRRTGNRIGEELVKRNCAQVVYEPTGVPIVNLDE